MGFGKDGKGAIVKEQTSFALAGLAGQGIVIDNSEVLLDNDFRILKSEMTATLRGMTNDEGVGLVLYMTEGDLTAAEIEANIEQNGPQRLGDQILEEVASRWVRRIGTVLDGVSTERMFRNKYGGALLEATPRWTFRRARSSTAGGWNWAVYNDGVTITTGATVNVTGTHYGVWVD